MDEYVEQFFSEEREALAEVCRLSAVFKDALWYNMELYDKRYNPSRIVALQGSRTAKCGNAEHTHFPVYYAGPLRDAPELPLAIIMNELRDAKRYYVECMTQTLAPYEWAPGGEKYEQLCKTTLVGRQIPETHD